jgi:hypothetical protein
VRSQKACLCFPCTTLFGGQSRVETTNLDFQRTWVLRGQSCDARSTDKTDPFVISTDSNEGMHRPFGALSDSVGFNEQVKDISDQLAELHYERSGNSEPTFSVIKLLFSKKITSINFE